MTPHFKAGAPRSPAIPFTLPIFPVDGRSRRPPLPGAWPFIELPGRAHDPPGPNGPATPIPGIETIVEGHP